MADLEIPVTVHHIHYTVRMTPLMRLVQRFNTDPVVQLKIHRVMTYVWIVNAIAATVVFFTDQGFWARASVFYLVLISLYANFATDYGAVPAAEAAVHAEALAKASGQDTDA